ncbi:hypothetical protein V8E51_012903 [Hyaloscypha variabilis]
MSEAIGSDGDRVAQAFSGREPSTNDGSRHTSQTSSTLFGSEGEDSTSENEEVKKQESKPLRRTLEKLAQKHPKPMDHPAITFGPAMILLFDIVIPCIVYYTWYNSHKSSWKRDCQPFWERGAACPVANPPEFDDNILGYAVICFGIGELYILIARVCRLLRYPEQCAPLLSRSKWELDATSWVYGVSMLLALIPFVVGSTMEIPELYLYSPGFIMAFLGVLMLITIIPVDVKFPVGINSQPRGSRLRPFVYYAAEDFIAVDGLQDREFRVRYNARYDSSKPFRRMFLYLTLWWVSGILIYLGCLSAIIWTLPFHYAFGLSLGVLFGYIIIWAIVTFLWVNIEMDRQKKAYEKVEC